MKPIQIFFIFMLVAINFQTDDIPIEETKLDLPKATESDRFLKGKGKTTPDDVKNEKMLSNKKYQKLLVSSLSKFREEQIKVHKDFEKTFKKKQMAIEKENKDLLFKTINNYALFVDEEDERIRNMHKQNHEISMKEKNDFVILHVKNDPESPPRSREYEKFLNRDDSKKTKKKGK